MRLAMAQIGPRTGDLEGNAERVVRAIRQARQRGCDLIITPEMAITGYLSGDLLQVEAYVRANKALLAERIAPEVQDLVAVVGFVDCERGPRGAAQVCSNAAALVQHGTVTRVARKQHLCRYRYYDETRYFTPGGETMVAEVNLPAGRIRLGVLICEDLWDDGYATSPYREAAEAGADLAVVLNASPFELGKFRRRVEIIRAQQAAAPLPLAYVNTVGIGDNLKDIIVFDGRSMAFNREGRMIACGKRFAEELCIVELDDKQRAAPITPPYQDDEQELFAALTFALKEYCLNNGFTQAALGVSGGVDSALCAALAAEALGPQNVLGVSMPGPYSSQATRADAASVCENLGIEHAVIPIQQLQTQAVASLSNWREPRRGVTLENFQARLRGMMLMGIANDTGRLVISTGNKTELGLGYCTLYGDMVGGLVLIGDVNKMQVYRLAEHVNRRAGRDVIPQSVLVRVPTAELAENQVDPFDYPVVAPLADDIIARQDPATLLERFRNREMDERYPADLYERYDESAFEEVLKDTYRRYRDSAFKRSQSSPIVIVSQRAMGFDLRETIINWWYRDNPVRE